MNLSLCMIVKDEAESLPRCLASVAGTVDEIVLVDTGSTDGTPDIARQFGARVEHRAWTDDFAAARNESLALAQGRWILVLDADEELPTEMQPVLTGLLCDESVEGYLVQVVNIVGDDANPDTETGVNLRLFRNRPGYRFSGRLHEQVAENILRVCPGARLVDSGLQIRHWGYLDRVVAARGKQGRNLALAKALVAAAPGDPFAHYNLAIELQRQQDYAGAVAEFAASYALHAPGTYWASKLVKSYVLALTALQRRREALALLEQSLLRYERFTDLYFLKGILLEAEGDHHAAAACFQTCLDLGPAPVPPYSGVEAALGTYKASFALGQQYEALGRFDEAAAAFRQAFAGKPTWLEPIHRLGGVLIKQQGVAGACGELRQLLGVGPATEVLLANMLVRHRRYDVALEQLEQAGLGAAPAAGDAVAEAAAYLRSRCLLKLGRYQEAFDLAALVPPTSPHHRAARVTQVFCLWVEGREAEARRFMRKQRLGPDFRRSVGDLFVEEAREVLEEGLRRFPEATMLQEALVTLTNAAVQP